MFIKAKHFRKINYIVLGDELNYSAQETDIFIIDGISALDRMKIHPDDRSTYWCCPNTGKY